MLLVETYLLCFTVMFIPFGFVAVAFRIKYGHWPRKKDW